MEILKQAPGIRRRSDIKDTVMGEVEKMEVKYFLKIIIFPKVNNLML